MAGCGYNNADDVYFHALQSVGKWISSRERAKTLSIKEENAGNAKALARFSDDDAQTFGPLTAEIAFSTGC